MEATLSDQPFRQYCADADHVDIKTITSKATLPEFVAGLLSYYPGWIKQLYRVRYVFVRMLGLRQTGVPTGIALQAADVPMQPGANIGFFTVAAAHADRYWIAGVSEAHLTAYLGVAAEPLGDDMRQFHVVTIVRYHSWAGPVYFNVIRPFHHLVVAGMMRAGARYRAPVAKGL